MGEVCELFVRIAERCGEVYGCPVPQRVLTLGDTDVGWSVRLNPTNDELDGVPSLTAVPAYHGFPAGVVNVAGGMFIGSERPGDTEREFRAWLKTATPSPASSGKEGGNG